MRPLPPLLYSLPPLALIILLPMDRNTLEPVVEATSQPCWSRGGQQQCQPLPQSMLEFMEVGGAAMVRAVFPTRIAPVQVTKTTESTTILQKHILTFEIPESAEGEILESAELRLTLPWNFRGQKWLAKKDMASVFLVPDSLEMGIQSTVKLDSSPIKYVPKQHYNNSTIFAPRVSLNVTAALLPNPLMQQTDVRMEKPDGLLNLELQLQGSRKSLRQAMPKKLTDDNKGFRTHVHPPQLLLFYSLDEQPINSSSKMDDKWRWKRSVKDDYEEESNMIWNEKAEITKFKELSGVKRKQARNSCRRQPLYVDFAEINYDSWIVAPSGYEAYQCVGKCFFPVSDHLSPTKHAILQTLVHSAFPRKAARACCVPTRLEPISLLYLDKNGVLTYHFNYDDMVVTECGCR